MEFESMSNVEATSGPHAEGSALTEIARKRNGAVRTGHPIYSFAVLGQEKKLFDRLINDSGYGDNSPFALIHNLNGKIASLDLDDQNSMTFYHCCRGVVKS